MGLLLVLVIGCVYGCKVETTEDLLHRNEDSKKKTGQLFGKLYFGHEGGKGVDNREDSKRETSRRKWCDIGEGKEGAGELCEDLMTRWEEDQETARPPQRGAQVGARHKAVALKNDNYDLSSVESDCRRRGFLADECEKNIIGMIVPHRFRPTRLLRPVYVITVFRVSKNTTKWMLQTISRSSSIVPLLILFVSFFTIVFFIMFSDADPTNFGTPDVTFFTLFILLTTANHPDCALEIMEWSIFYYLFFVLYMILGWMCLSNLFLFMIFNDFHDIMLEHYHKKAEDVFESFNKTFFYLRDNDFYNYDDQTLKTFLKLCKHEVDLDHAEALLRNVQTATTDVKEEEHLDSVQSPLLMRRPSTLALGGDEFAVYQKMRNFQEQHLQQVHRQFDNYQHDIEMYMVKHWDQFESEQRQQIAAQLNEILEVQDRVENLSAELQDFLEEHHTQEMNSPRPILTTHTSRRSMTALVAPFNMGTSPRLVDRVRLLFYATVSTYEGTER